MAINVAAAWLLGVGALSAQNSTPSIVTWPANDPSPSAPGGVKGFVVQQTDPPFIRTATFTASPAPAIPRTVQPQVLKQVPILQYKPAPEGGADIIIRTELPGVDLVFTRESEAQLFDTIRAENQARPGAQRVTFPERGVVTREKYAARSFKQMVEKIEPSFVMHRRLYFENLNTDRYGWEIGNLQPGICVGSFLYDVVALPYHCWTRPFQQWDSSAGKCLPGDNTPLQCYREEFSVTGLVGEAGVIALGFAAFP